MKEEERRRQTLFLHNRRWMPPFKWDNVGAILVRYYYVGRCFVNDVLLVLRGFRCLTLYVTKMEVSRWASMEIKKTKEFGREISDLRDFRCLSVLVGKSWNGLGWEASFKYGVFWVLRMIVFGKCLFIRVGAMKTMQ